MSETYSGLRQRRKRTHPSKCPCCVNEQEVEPENEPSAGSENTIEVNIRQSKRKKAIKRKCNDAEHGEPEKDLSAHKTIPKKRKLRDKTEESTQKTVKQPKKSLNKTKFNGNQGKSSKNEKISNKGEPVFSEKQKKELKTKRSENERDVEINEDMNNDEHHKALPMSHNTKTRKTKGAVKKAKVVRLNKEFKKGNSKTLEDKSVKTQEKHLKKNRRVPVEKPFLSSKAINKTALQLKIKTFDNLYDKLKSKDINLTLEKAYELLTGITNESLFNACKLPSTDEDKKTVPRPEKKGISDNEEIVSQAAEALVSFRSKSPITRDDNSRANTLSTSSLTDVPSTTSEQIPPVPISSASKPFNQDTSVAFTTLPSTSVTPSLNQSIFQGIMPTLSQSFPQLLQPTLTSPFSNLMPMVSSHGALPSFSQMTAHLKTPQTINTNPSTPLTPVTQPTLPTNTLPSPSIILQNQAINIPSQLQNPLPLTSPVCTGKSSLNAAKKPVSSVETKKTTPQKQQPLKGLEEVIGNVGNVPQQPIVWNIKSPVVFLGSPQNLGAVPRKLVASPSTSQSGHEKGYRPVAPKPLTTVETSRTVSSVANVLTLGGRPILPRTQLQTGDDVKKLQTSGMSFVSQLQSINTSIPYQGKAPSSLQAITQVTSANPKRTTLMSPSLSAPIPQNMAFLTQENIKSTTPLTVNAKQAVKKLVHERTKFAELKKEGITSTTKLQAILPLPSKELNHAVLATVTSENPPKNNEFNLEQAATALLSIGVPDGIETIGLKQGPSDPSKDDYEEDVVFTSKGTFRVGDVDVDPRYNRIGREGYTCGKCNKIFTSLSYLARHIKRVCPDMNGRKWKCTLCDKAFRHPFGLQQHVYTHTGERPHKCPLCPKAFYSSNDLRRHSRIHSGERPYKCKHCDKSFATTISLKTHTYIHTGEKPHKCPQCPKTFATSSKLGRHIVTHSEQRPFSCEQCPKSFNRSGDLRRHNLAVHDGKEKSHDCDMCSATFVKAADLRRHASTVHQKSSKTFHCEECNTQFTTLLCLKMHRETYHNPVTTESDSVHTCDVCGKMFSNSGLLTQHKLSHDQPCCTTGYNLSQFQHIAPKPSDQVVNSYSNA